MRNILLRKNEDYPVITVGALNRESNLPNASFTEYKFENQNSETAVPDNESLQAGLPTITIELCGENKLEKPSEDGEIKQGESVLSCSTIVRGGSWVIDQAQAGINADMLLPPSVYPKSSRRRKSKRVKTLWTSQAPIEIISFFYRMSREARERGSCSSFDHLPDDTLIPEPIQYERSWLGLISAGASCDPDVVGTPSWCQSDLSNKLISANHIQIIQRSLSWLSQPLSQLTSDHSLQLGPSGRTRKFSSSSLNEDDLKILVDESVKIDLKTLSPKMKNLSLLNRELTFDSVGNNHTEDIFPILASLGIGRSHLPNSSKRTKKSPLYSTARSSRRCNSSDFAFSEANEISQVDVSSMRSPKDAKEYLVTCEEKEDRDPSMNMLMHLVHGSRERLVSQSMRRNRRSRDEMRREALSNGFSETESEPLIARVLLRAATEKFVYI